MSKGQISKGRSIKRDISAFFLLAFALLLSLSLISHNPHDTTWFSADSKNITEGKYNNLAGLIGAECSALLFEVFGYASLLMPLFIFLFSLNLIRKEKIDHIVIKSIGFILFFTSLCTLLQFPFRHNELIEFSKGITPGGIIGLYLTGPSERLAGPAGTYIILVSFFILSLFLLTEFSIIDITRKAFNAVAVSVRWSYEKIDKAFDFYINWKQKKKHSANIKPKIESEKKKPRPNIEQIEIDMDKGEEIPEPEQQRFDFAKEYMLPSLNLLREPKKSESKITKQDILLNSKILEKKLLDFGIEGKVCEVRTGPVITMYEFEPAPGIKLNKIVSLTNDLAMAMKTINVRIVAPIPGKGTVGIEIPNNKRENVYLKEILQSDKFQSHPSKICIALGKDILGNVVVEDLAKMPHLLIAGATGSGKSVAVNMMILSLLYRATPKEVKMIMVDPKMLELSVYQDIPHLLTPVVTNPKEASYALQWAVREMERRYQLMKNRGVRSITRYNRLLREENRDEEENILPYIVIFIDELADLMIAASKTVEDSIQRLSQMARAAGIHLIMATQRPSVDVITGVIKANFSWRIALQVSVKVDSRTILDQNGAEQLLGKGDMLLMSPGYNRLTRIHGAFVSDTEVQAVVNHIKAQGISQPDMTVLTPLPSEKESEIEEEEDEIYEEVVRWLAKTKSVSISLVQRKFRVGYNRAARIIEKMEAEGLIGPADGVKPREVLIDETEVEEFLENRKKYKNDNEENQS
ncbi:MAG: DNA translocase FtsK [Candidatus Schekmanbacteria bacterium]|nr:MAG: DNA translocase FtsK [Candidatus Schekmanbacteria bacterium]